LHQSLRKVFPLLISLLDLNDMCEESTINFWKDDFVLYDCINPIFFVLERQVDDETSALSEIFLQFIID